MLPDYLPIIHVSQFHGDEKIRNLLLDGLRKELAIKGVRVSVVERLTQYTREGGVDSGVIETIANTDLLFVNGRCDKDCAQLDLGQRLDTAVNEAAAYLRFTCPEASETTVCADTIFRWLQGCMNDTPLWGCVLIGGKSSRMGSPKHLIKGGDGKSWLERSVDFLSAQVSNIVISGNGEIPLELDSLERIDDLPGRSGPLAGISAVLKQKPFVSWIVMACDMPDISVESLRWLIDQRRPGRLAVIPHNPQTGRGEPLYAWYDFRCAPLFDVQAAKGAMRMNSLSHCAGVYNPVIPGDLVRAWRNVNRPEELDRPLTERL